MSPSVEVASLTFTYKETDAPAVADVSLRLYPGARCLLLGRNGAGKSTLLHLLAGRHMIPESAIRMLGRPAFHDTALVADVAFLGGNFPMDLDIRVSEMLASRPDADPVRRQRLLDVLAIDPAWRMHRCSDGQRRRVQILLGLLRPPKILLLDEVTTDLDLIARVDLLALLQNECETRGMTIVYATHILDGLSEWATEIVLLERGRLALHEPMTNVARPLLATVEGWLRKR